MWLWNVIIRLYYFYVYVVDRLMLRDTLVEWKQRDSQHARISMDDEDTLEARLLGRGSVVMDLQWYCCVYVVHISYSVIVPMVLCAFRICSDGYRWCYVYVGYAVLCTYCIARMMDMRHCVHMVLCTCWICNDVYTWCYVHVLYVLLCTYVVVRMLYKWYYVHMVLCACGVMYMSCMWYHVHMVLYTHCTSGVVYMWHCVCNVQVVPCTCDVMHMLCRWCYVQVVLFACCTYGTGVHVVLCTCHTCCVTGMRYYVCALHSHGIMTYVFIVLYFVYVFVLCCELGVGVCVVCQV